MQKFILFVVKHVQSMLVTVLTIWVTNIHRILYKRRAPTFKRCHQHHCYQKEFEKTKTKTCMIHTVWKMEIITIILCLIIKLWCSKLNFQPLKLKVSAVKIPGIKVQFSRTQGIIFYLICFIFIQKNRLKKLFSIRFAGLRYLYHNYLNRFVKSTKICNQHFQNRFFTKELGP